MKVTYSSVTNFKLLQASKTNLSTSACISILDVQELPVELLDAWRYKLSLQFLDVDEGPLAFSREQARETVKLMLAVKQDEEIEELNIHCFAGISRSRAMYNFFMFYILQDPRMRDNPPAFIGNAFVYSLLVEVYHTEFL